MSVRVHELKTDPGPFQSCWLLLKQYEVRIDDRDFALGEVVHLREWHPHIGYTGRELDNLTIIHKLSGGQYGLANGFCVLGLDFTRVKVIDVEVKP